MMIAKKKYEKNVNIRRYISLFIILKYCTNTEEKITKGSAAMKEYNSLSIIFFIEKDNYSYE